MIWKLIKFRENQFNDLETNIKKTRLMIWKLIKYKENQFNDLETNKIQRKPV